MMFTRRTTTSSWTILAGIVCLATAPACDSPAGAKTDAPAPDDEPGEPDLRVSTHTVDLGLASADGLAFMARAADAHERADAAASANEAAAILDAVWETRPGAETKAGESGVVEIVALELVARRAELAVATNDAGEARQMIDRLEPLVGPSSSMPRDRSAARALVALGDSARIVGDDRLAVESYARSIDLMAVLMGDAK